MSSEPHELASLLLDLGSAGVELAAHPTDAGRLRYRRATPEGCAADLPPDLAAGLRLFKAPILELLSDGYRPGPPTLADDAAYVFEERLGIADDLNMPTHRGAPAWLIAVGESMLATLSGDGGMAGASPAPGADAPGGVWGTRATPSPQTHLPVATAKPAAGNRRRKRKPSGANTWRRSD